MGTLIKFPDKGFISTFRQDFSIPLKKYKFLQPVQAQYDRELVEALIQQMDACYSRNDHIETLQTSYKALRCLLGSELIIPRTIKDEDEDRLLLEMLAQALIKWDKASAWLGYSDKGPLTTFQISTDLKHIYKAFSDDNRVSSIESTFGYSLQRMGDFRAAWHRIHEGLKEAKSLQGLRAILGAKASLLSKAGWYKVAASCYHECVDIDEKRGTSKASEGLLIAELGLAEAHLPGHAISGERNMEKGLIICRKAGHPGFELQIQRDRIRYYLQKKDIDASMCIEGEARKLLEQHPESFGGLRASIYGLTEFINNSYQGKKRRIIQVEIAYSPLQELMQTAKDELSQGGKYSAMTLITEALEMSTLLLCLKNRKKLNLGFLKKLKKKESDNETDVFGLEKHTLKDKNRCLFEAGVYDEETKQKIEELQKLRNKLFHGYVHSGWVKVYDHFDSLSDFYNWLCLFIEAHGLRDYQFKEDEIYL